MSNENEPEPLEEDQEERSSEQEEQIEEMRQNPEIEAVAYSDSSEDPENLEIPENPESSESGNVENQEGIPPPPLITCPYNEEHQVPAAAFNDHVWKCRAEKMAFYPHALSLKRCRYNLTHFLPEEEIGFHELFCKTETEQLHNLLNTEPIELNVAEYLAAHRRMKANDEADVLYSSDSDSEGSGRDQDEGSVTSEIADSEVEEQDARETVKRLECLRIEKLLNGNDGKI